MGERFTYDLSFRLSLIIQSSNAGHGGVGQTGAWTKIQD
jgi:hypothetical protein